MNREFYKESNQGFQNLDPPVEFTMEDYDKAVQDPEYVRRITEPVVVTPPTPNSDEPAPTEHPDTTQEPTEEGPITEVPQEEPTQRAPQKSREESNLESGLNGPSWQCNEDHGRRLRRRTYFIEENNETLQDWDDEDWNNIYYLDNQNPEAPEETPEKTSETPKEERD